MNKLNPQLLLILLVASLGLNFYQYATNVDRKSNNYPLLAKRLFVANPNDLIINFVPLRTQLRDYITKQPEKVAVYFEYLPTGNSISVGASDEFFRASLVKVPSVMRAYKLSEEGKLNLNKKITLKTEHLDSGFGNLYQSPVGTELTIREVIRLVLTDSDNTAFNLLHDEVNVKQLGDTPDGD